MSLSSRDISILEHMLSYCNKIEATISRFGEDFETFVSDEDYRDSVSMNILQIGELSGKFTDEYIIETRDDMNWRAMKAMRNMFAHNYGSMDI